MAAWVLVAAGLATALAAAVVLFRLSGWFLPWLKGTLGLVVVLAGLFVAALGWSTLQWHAVAPERSLYRLSIASNGEGAWRVELHGEGVLSDERVVQGDRLEITGRLLVLEAPLSGSKPAFLYRTDSIRGFDPDAQTPIQFNAGVARRGADWVDPWRWDRTVPLPLVRAETLYPLWVPMVDGAVFEVVMQGNQIVPIAANSAAEQALQGRE